MSHSPKQRAPRAIDPAAVAKVDARLAAEMAYLARLAERLRVVGHPDAARVANTAMEHVDRLRREVGRAAVPIDFPDLGEPY